jgi:thiamine biosynthesis lipoprotein
LTERRRFLRAALVLGVGLLLSCSSGRSMYQKSEPLMDTLVTVTVVSGSADQAGGAIQSAFSTIGKFGDRINFFSASSELSDINRNAGIRPVKVSPDTLDIIEKAIYISKKSGGAFDATVGPETSLWDFHKKIKPSDEQIKKNLHLVNYRNIVIDKEKSTVFLREKGMLLDLGGIAKGYAADLAVADLKRNGITAGIVANAGDIRVFGSKPDGSPWNVGIENPRHENDSDEIIAKVKLVDEAISTSGDYQRYFILDGRRYHHLIDPATGYPAYGCRSVSVITDSGAFTDAFSTAVFVLGPEKGMKLVRKLGMDAVIVKDDGTIMTTPGLNGIITIEKSH